MATLNYKIIITKYLHIHACSMFVKIGGLINHYFIIIIIVIVIHKNEKKTLYCIS